MGGVAGACLRCRRGGDSVRMSCSRKDPLAVLLAGVRGSPPGDAGGIVLIVGSDPDRVESDLAAGVVACPACGGCAGSLGLRSAPECCAARPGRWRSALGGPGAVRAARRMCCCPMWLLARRVDRGSGDRRALTAAAGGAGSPQGGRAGWPALADGAGLVAPVPGGAARRAVTHFAAWALPAGCQSAALSARPDQPLADAVEAIGVAARAASLRFGSRPPWSWASVLTVGRLLSNTNSPWLAP